MKKKIIIVVAVLIIGLIGGSIFFVADGRLEHYKMNKERINNCTTLSKYVEYHDLYHMSIANNNNGADYHLYFYAEDIKCDLLQDKNILYFNANYMGDVLILDDYTIYETAFKSDKMYSNGQQCKQIEIETKIKRLQIQNDLVYLISEDDKYYQFSYEKIKEVNQWGNETAYLFLKNESIKKIITKHNPSNTGTNIHSYLVLKDDGQIYEQEYERKHNSTTNGIKTIMINETLLYSSEDYGHITDFAISSYLEHETSKIVKIVSDKGLYYLKQTGGQQYIDTEATYELVSSDIYTKYKSDIKFINTNYVFTTDNNIVETDMLCRDIDKDILSDSEIAELNSKPQIEETNQTIVENPNEEETENSSTKNSNSQTNKTNSKNNSNSSNNKTNNKTEKKETATNINSNIENNNKQEIEEKKKDFINIKKIWMENDGGQFSVGDKVVIHAIVESKYELKSKAMAVIADVNSASKHAEQVSVTQNNTEYHYTYHLEITDEFIPGLWRYQCSVFEDKYSTRGEDLNNKFKFSFIVI